MKTCQDGEIFLRLLVEALTEFGNVEDKRRKEVLVNSENFLYAAINEDCPNQGFKDITKDFASLIQLDVPIVELEVFPERVVDIPVKVILLHQGLSLLLFCPLRHFPILLDLHLLSFCTFLFIEDELLQPKEAHQLSQEVVLSQQTLCLVSVKRHEVLLRDELLLLPLWDVVLFKHRVSDQI